MDVHGPMLPRAPEQCRVIQFSSIGRKPEAAQQRGAIDSYLEKRRAKREAKLLELTTSPEKLTVTCKNARLRLSRRDAWRSAERLTNYLAACMNWNHALQTAQRFDVADANTFAAVDSTQPFAFVTQWRTAVVKQMLTPSPDASAVAWKRSQLRQEQWRYVITSSEKLERAIAADVQWLQDHPTRRRSNDEGGAA
jgi:hypothetical protein